MGSARIQWSWILYIGYFQSPDREYSHAEPGQMSRCSECVGTRSLDQTIALLVFFHVQVDGLRSLDRVLLFINWEKLFSISSGHFGERQLQYYPRSVFLERCPDYTHLKELRGAQRQF